MRNTDLSFYKDLRTHRACGQLATAGVFVAMPGRTPRHIFIEGRGHRIGSLRRLSGRGLIGSIAENRITFIAGRRSVWTGYP